jgi:hypothetical protein
MKRLTTPELSFGVPQFIADEMDNNTKVRVTFKQGDKIVFYKDYYGDGSKKDLTFSNNTFKITLQVSDTEKLAPGIVKMELTIQTIVEGKMNRRISDTMTANVEEVLFTNW